MKRLVILAVLAVAVLAVFAWQYSSMLADRQMLEEANQKMRDSISTRESK